MKGLISHPTNGLGNRLRSMASTYIFSRRLDCPFYLSWPNYCDLWKRDFTKSPEIDGRESIFTQRGDSRLNLSALQNKPVDYIKFSTGQSFVAPGISVAEYNSLKSEFYNSLHPHGFIEDEAQKFVSKFFKGTVLGIQLRGGDHLKNGICLNVEDSLPTIDPYITEYDTVFVTSNEPSFIDYLKTFYPQKSFVSFTSSASLNRHAPGNQGGAFWGNKEKLSLMISDLIEWYILAEVDLLIGAFASSFSYESLFINKRTKFIEIKNPDIEMKTYWTKNTRDLVYL